MRWEILNELQTLFGGQDLEGQAGILAQNVPVLRDKGIGADPFGIYGDEGISHFEAFPSGMKVLSAV